MFFLNLKTYQHIAPFDFASLAVNEVGNLTLNFFLTSQEKKIEWHSVHNVKLDFQPGLSARFKIFVLTNKKFRTTLYESFIAVQFIIKSKLYEEQKEEYEVC